jgi:hypothetical protein
LRSAPFCALEPKGQNNMHCYALGFLVELPPPS